MLVGFLFVCCATELVARRADPGGFFMLKDAVEHHRLRPGLDESDTWGSLRYRLATNSLGWRDAHPGRAVRPSTERQRRIVFLGDSVTDGIGYDFERTFVGLVARRLDEAGSDVEVLNGGTVSYSPLLEYLRLKRFLADGYRTDGVVLLPDPSDVANELTYGRGYAVDAAGEPVRNSGIQFQNPMLWLLNSSALVRAGVRAVDLLPWQGQLRQLLEFRSAGADRPSAEPEEAAAGQTAPQTIPPELRTHWADDPAVLTGWGEQGLAALERNVGRIQELCRREGIDLLVVFYPHPQHLYLREDPAYYEVLRSYFPGLWATRERYLGRAPTADPTPWRQRMGRLCTQRRIACVDLHPELMATERWHELFIPDDVHLSDTGHQLVARVIARELLRRSAKGS